MDTSIRYGGESSALRKLTTNNNSPTVKYAGDVGSIKIHAKQKLQLDSNTLLQLNGELDTGTGAPTFFCALVRHLYPDLSASLGAGLHYDKNNKLQCTLRGKKAYPVASNRFVNFVLKGSCDIDQDLSQPTPHGAVELVWNILEFQKEQDVRLKVGYEIVDKIPYVQFRENNWTFNADINGRWNVRYNL
ncbi:outer envelope pore protein 21B, chloroplastic-like [Rutidosis leptorrhynchoides]|uniref:outer envelope pore protein 21B, chloroplastic-like n=1 Tax=Rutidosis leptorrhynchoides TaxID=125765 RepID=UPI003A997787